MNKTQAPHRPPAGMTPEMQAAAAELGAYSKAFAEAHESGGSREAILAILHAAEPPGVKAGTFHRMSFGLDALLEMTGNGRAKWLAIMSQGGNPATAAGGMGIIESLFVFSDPAAALESLGLGGDDLMSFRKSAHAFARRIDDDTAAAAVKWMIREMLRYWNWLPFLEAAAVEAPAPSARPDGSAPISTGSAPTTEPACTPPSGDSTPPLPSISGLQQSSAAAASIPAPASPTEPAPPQPAPAGPAIPHSVCGMPSPGMGGFFCCLPNGHTTEHCFSRGGVPSHPAATPRATLAVHGSPPSAFTSSLPTGRRR